MGERIINWATVITIAIFLTMIGWYFVTQKPIERELMSKSDEEYILMVLRQKAADDCVLTKVRDGVWACREQETGKVYMVRR